MRTDDTAWWRRPRVVVPLVGIVALTAVTVISVVDRDEAEASGPVVASTHAGYPARGDLVATGDWAPEAESAADAWRALPPGGAAEPPDPGRQVELMWAGDVDARDLPYAREHLRDETGGLGTARVILLQAFNRLAVAVAPVEAGGERTSDYAVVTATTDFPDDAAISARDGVLLLADTPDASDSVQVAGHDEAVAVHDGLVLDAPAGIAWREQAFAEGRDDYHGLVLTESGETMAVRDDTLWQALTDPASSARTEEALRNAYETAAARTGGSSLVIATLWDPVELENDRTMSVVALRADALGGREPSWVVAGGVDLADGGSGSSVRSVRLGTGQAPGLVHAGDRHGAALAARWFEPETLGTTHPQLVVVGGDGIAEVEVLTSDGVRPVPGAAAALPAWEDGKSGPVISPAVVVGRDTDGVPVTPIPAGDGHPPAQN